MIRYLKGRFYPQTDGSVIIETGTGIVFLVMIPANSQLYKHREGDEVRVFTLMTVREDDMSLYGFSSTEELELFRLLLTVNGVGAKAGIAIMGILPLVELKKAIATGNSKALTAASGVGARTAQRIILDLKDKVDFVDAGEDAEAEESPGADTSGDERKTAADALVSLGYTRAEASEAVRKVKDDGLTSEDYIWLALRGMI